MDMSLIFNFKCLIMAICYLFFLTHCFEVVLVNQTSYNFMMFDVDRVDEDMNKKIIK